MISLDNDGALVWFKDNDAQQCQATISTIDPLSGDIEYKNGCYYFVRHDGVSFLIHRDEGPAIIRRVDLTKPPTSAAFVWVNNGRIHRVDKPAVIAIPGEEQQEVFIHGFVFSLEEWKEIRAQKLDFVYTRNGVLKFYKKGTKILHRDGGPSVYCSRVGKEYRSWHQNGIIDRADGPAHISTGEDGIQRSYWFRRGRLDRVDGPAITRSDGTKEYAISNVRMDQEKFLRKIGALPKNVKMKDKAAGSNALVWQLYLDEVEAGYVKSLQSDAPLVKECLILLSKYYAARTPSTIEKLCAKIQKIWPQLNEKEQEIISDAGHEVWHELYKSWKRKSLLKPLGADWEKLKMVHFEVLNCDLNRNRKGVPAVPDTDAQMLKDPVVATETPEAIQTKGTSLGVVAGVCFAVAGALGIFEAKAKSKKKATQPHSVKQFVEV